MRRAAAVLVLAAGLASGACASDDRENLGVQTYLHNAQGYVDGGHYEQALVEFRRALEISPGNRKALLGEANCLYELSLSREPAVASPAADRMEEKAGALDPDDYGENGWKVLLVQGLVHARLSDLWAGQASLARKDAAAGDSGAEERARSAEASRDAQEEAATKAFEAVLACEDRMARNNLVALFFLASRGALRARGPEDYGRPLEYFRRYAGEVEKSKRLWVDMQKIEPDNAEVYRAKLREAERQEVELRDLVANIYFKQRRHEESIAELDRVLALAPDRAPAYFNRGRNQEELGRFGAAADDYERFLQHTDLPPGSPEVVEAVERRAKCEERLERK